MLSGNQGCSFPFEKEREVGLGMEQMRRREAALWRDRREESKETLLWWAVHHKMERKRWSHGSVVPGLQGFCLFVCF